jgi:hypothetical protein
MIATLFAILGIFLLLCSLPLAFWAYMEIRASIWSKSWFPIEGTVFISRVVSNRDCNGLPGHHFFVAYKYTIDKKEYESRYVRFGGCNYYTKHRAEQVTTRYPIGTNVKVWYDPEFPELSVLEPGFSLEIIYPITLFGIVFLSGSFLLGLSLFNLVRFLLS